MATQDASKIPLSLAAESTHRHFRLLELPAEILTLLTSSDPPTLELRASEGVQDDEGGHAVLCTPDKTFNLRQKNSSNTVYLIEPRDRAKNELPVPALQAIAQCHSSLELTQSRVDRYEAWKHMRAVVPYSRDDIRPGRTPKSKRFLFDQMPFHENLCREACLDLGVYEDDTAGAVLRLSAGDAYACWKDLTSTAQIKSIKLDAPFQLSEVVASEDGPGNQASLAVIESFSSLESATYVATIDAERCITWVGRSVLEHRAGTQMVHLKTFLEEWKDLLPESWRELADVAKINAYSQMSEDGKSIQFLEPSDDPAGSAPGTAAGKKRKWHDKFRPQKK